MHILCIDDEQQIRPILASLLQRYGENNNRSTRLNGLIDSAQGLVEAANHGHKYELVLLGLRLPDLAGTEIYRRIIAARPRRRGRIIFIAGYRQDLGADLANHRLPVPEKPVRYEQQKARINRLIH